MPIGSITYDDTSRREDLTDIITNVAPDATPLLSSWKSVTSENTLHEYLRDTLAAAGTNAQTEGAAFTVSDPTHPTRLNNNTQVFIDWVTISGTQMAVTHAGQPDPMKYQIAKQLKEHAKDIENALMAGSRASGASGVARQMVGVINAISTNATARASGASLGETDFNDIFAMIYTQTDDVANEVYVGATLKRDISGFTANSTKYVDAKDMMLVRPVHFYDTRFFPKLVSLNSAICWNVLKLALLCYMTYHGITVISKVKICKILKWIISRKGSMDGWLEYLMGRVPSLSRVTAYQETVFV